MNKTFYVLSLLLISAGLSFGQNYELEKGKARSAKTEVIKSILLDDGRVVSFKTKGTMMSSLSGKKLQVEILDEDLNPVKSLETDIKYLDVWSTTQDNQYQFAEILDGIVYVFYSKQDSKEDFSLYARELDIEAMKLSKDEIRIAKFNKKGKIDSGSVDYSLSKDRNKLLVYFSEYVKIDGKRNTFTEMVVMDSQLEVLWNEEYLDDQGKRFKEYKSYDVNNKGEVFILKQIFEKNYATYSNNKVTYTFSIVKFDTKGQFAVEKDLDLPDYHIKDIQVVHNDQDELICVGFYSNLGRNSADGTYYARFSSDRLTKKSSQIDEFTVDFMVDGKSNRTERKAVRKDNRGSDVELPNLLVRDIVLRSDGGVVLVGEEYYLEEDSEGRQEYYYNDIMVININSLGKIDWAKKIYKRQELIFAATTGVLSATVSAVNMVRAGFLSYTLCVAGDKIYFVYNDHKDNFDGRDGKDYRLTPDNLKSVSAITSIDGNGRIDKKVLFKNETNKVVVYPQNCVQLNSADPKLLLFGRWKSTERYMRLSF